MNIDISSDKEVITLNKVELDTLSQIAKLCGRKRIGKETTNNLYSLMQDPMILMITNKMLFVEFYNQTIILVPDEYEYQIRFLMSFRSKYYYFYSDLMRYLTEYIQFHPENRLLSREIKIYNALFSNILNPASQFMRGDNAKGFLNVNPHHPISQKEAIIKYYKYGHEDGSYTPLFN